MPTTTIATDTGDATFRRRVAKRLSFWWRRQGADLNHVITHFVPVTGERVYSGPFPLTGPYALVTCVVADSRDRTFRRRYAVEVRDALGPDISPARIFVSFHGIDPADHFGPVRHGADVTDTPPALEAPR